MQVPEFIIDRLGTHQGILVLRSLALLSFLTNLENHSSDPFRVSPMNMLRCSRVILQTHRCFIGTTLALHCVPWHCSPGQVWRSAGVATDPPMHPATGSLYLPGNLTFVPTLQMQGNGLFAQRNLGLHRSPSCPPPQKV